MCSREDVEGAEVACMREEPECVKRASVLALP